MTSPQFLITTPLFYPSGPLHLGHAWTTFIADVINRYQQQKGFKTFFLTGIDEHGGKIAHIAQIRNLSPRAYVDQMYNHYQFFWQKLEIKYDVLVRTSNPKHVKVVQHVLQKFKTDRQIYSGHYQGLYCTKCEEFLTAQQLKGQICQICRQKPAVVNQPTYFLKTAQYRSWLLKLLHPPTPLLQPSYVSNELISNFLQPSELHDLSITRSDVLWGCPMPDAPSQTIYVWIDALIGYLSGTGYLNSNSNFNRWWSFKTRILQIIGKEIARFHGIYWPILLKNLNLRLPNQILTHSWITIRKFKMSKSLGNSINPLILIDRYSVAALRCYLFCNMKIKSDNSYDHRLFLNFYNSFLVNSLGNLHSRLITMVIKYFAGQIPVSNPELWGSLKDKTSATIIQFQQHMDQYQIFDAAQIIIKLVDACNKTIEVKKPWVLFQTNLSELSIVIDALVYSLIVVACLLYPVLLVKSKQILQDLGFDTVLTLSQIQNPEIIFRSQKVQKNDHLFKRIDIDQELQILNS